MSLEKCDFVVEGSCRLSHIDLPPNAKIFTVQAHGFSYGGPTSKQSHLSHCYELPCGDMVNMRTAMLSSPPSIDAKKEHENIVASYAVYQGMLTPTGLLQVLPRPIKEYYSPPAVMIVGDSQVNMYRAILVDPAYTLMASNSFVYNEDKTLNAFKTHIRECMKEKNYSEAAEQYRDFSAACWALLKVTDKAPKI